MRKSESKRKSSELTNTPTDIMPEKFVLFTRKEDIIHALYEINDGRVLFEFGFYDENKS